MTGITSDALSVYLNLVEDMLKKVIRNIPDEHRSQVADLRTVLQITVQLYYTNLNEFSPTMSKNVLSNLIVASGLVAKSDLEEQNALFKNVSVEQTIPKLSSELTEANISHQDVVPVTALISTGWNDCTLESEKLEKIEAVESFFAEKEVPSAVLVPSFSFTHSSETITGLTDCESSEDEVGSQTQKKKISPKQQRLLKAQTFSSYQTTQGNIAKCYFEHKGVSKCVAFKHKTRTHISSNLRALIVDFNLCRDSPGKIMSVAAAKELRSRNLSPTRWTCDEYDRVYQFQLLRGYQNYWTDEKYEDMMDQIEFFNLICSKSERLIVNVLSGNINRKKGCAPVTFDGGKTQSDFEVWLAGEGRHTIIATHMRGGVHVNSYFS